MHQNKCKICKNIIIGRTDKLYCSEACKSFYHRSLRNFVNQKTEDIDKILHRNRVILHKVLGKKNVQIKVKRLVLS